MHAGGPTPEMTSCVCGARVPMEGGGAGLLSKVGGMGSLWEGGGAG